MVEGGLREHVGVVLHIFFGVFVGLQQLEFESTKEDGVAEKEIALAIVVVAYWVCVLLALHKLTSNAARVLIADLVDLNGIVSTVERHDEAAAFIIRLS